MVCTRTQQSRGNGSLPRSHHDPRSVSLTVGAVTARAAIPVFMRRLFRHFKVHRTAQVRRLWQTHTCAPQAGRGTGAQNFGGFLGKAQAVVRGCTHARAHAKNFKWLYFFTGISRR